jgi:hypothetical protein
MQKELEDLFKKEALLVDELRALDSNFILVEHLFHWTMNFHAGLRNLRLASKRAASGRLKERKAVLAIHRDVRINFHWLLQIPYIVHEHFRKKFGNGGALNGQTALEALFSNFEKNDTVQLLLMLRNKAVHEVLLDEYVTLMKPVNGPAHLEITLPAHTSETLLKVGDRGKTILGSSAQYYSNVFLPGTKGFIYLFEIYEKELLKFEKDFLAQLKIALAADYKKRHSLRVRIGHVKAKMKKFGVVFVDE